MTDDTSLRPRPGETPEQTLERVIGAVRKVADQEGERQELAERLGEFRLEATTFWRERFMEWDEGSGMYDENTYAEGRGDEFAPFFSEAFLYNLVGKDEARSILGIIRHLCVLAEVDFR
jgi:hypothetical protein